MLFHYSAVSSHWHATLPFLKEACWILIRLDLSPAFDRVNRGVWITVSENYSWYHIPPPPCRGERCHPHQQLSRLRSLRGQFWVLTFWQYGVLWFSIFWDQLTKVSFCTSKITNLKFRVKARHFKCSTFDWNLSSETKYMTLCEGVF